MTYNVFGGTINLAQLNIKLLVDCCLRISVKSKVLIDRATYFILTGCSFAVHSLTNEDRGNEYSRAGDVRVVSNVS